MDTVVWVSAVASALMALAAFIALGLEVWREYRRRQDAGKRVGIAAFLLRRQLNSWLDELPTDHGFPCWANDMTKHLDRAEARATVIAQEGAGLLPASATKVHSAVRLFLDAAHLLNEAAVGKQQNPSGL